MCIGKVTSDLVKRERKPRFDRLPGDRFIGRRVGRYIVVVVVVVVGLQGFWAYAGARELLIWHTRKGTFSGGVRLRVGGFLWTVMKFSRSKLRARDARCFSVMNIILLARKGRETTYLGEPMRVDVSHR